MTHLTPRKRATTTELLEAFAARGVRPVCEGVLASAETFVVRNSKEVRVAVRSRELLLALDYQALFFPAHRAAIEEIREAVRLGRRRHARLGDRELSIVWRKRAGDHAPRALVQVPLAVYLAALDVTPPPGGQRSEHRLRVRYEQDRVTIFTDRLATDAPVTTEPALDHDRAAE